MRESSKSIGRTITCLLLLAAPLALSAATIETLNAPAWVERGSTRFAAALGQRLNADDRVVTGSNARVLLRLDDESLVKLGEDATLHLKELGVAEQDSTLRGFLDVLRGAFRFTTTKLGKDRRRDIKARLRTATIGIRGTDVWGKTEPERDFVVLLEGAIDIERDGETYPLDEPLSLFMAPRGAPPLPIAPVDTDDLGRWAQETEPQAGQGVQQGDGTVRLHLASLRSAAAAAAVVAQLGESGWHATSTEVALDSGTWFRVSVAGFASRDDARAARGVLSADGRYPSAWIAAE